MLDLVTFNLVWQKPAKHFMLTHTRGSGVFSIRTYGPRNHKGTKKELNLCALCVFVVSSPFGNWKNLSEIIMKVNTNVKAGDIRWNHNEKMIKDHSRQ